MMQTPHLCGLCCHLSLLARLPLQRRNWMPYAIGTVAMYWVFERMGAFF
jgi:hypothetical protein